MPKILFAGGRLDSGSIISGTPSEVTTAGSFDATYCDAGLQCLSGDVFELLFRDASGAPVNLVTGETGYFHGEYYKVTSSGGSVGLMPWAAYDASGYPWLAVRYVSSSWGLYYNSGTGPAPAWTAVGLTWANAAATRYVLDIKITLGSPHQVEVSRDGSRVASGSFTQASLTSLRSVRVAGDYASGFPVIWSQLMGAEGRSTINGKVRYSRGTGAGSNSGWTGGVANVNEAVNSDATVDSTTAAGVRQTYAMGDVTVPAGYVIASVFHFLRAKNDGAAPQNIKSSVRQGGTNYDSAANMPGIGTSFASLVQRYDNDPSTGALWTQSGFNSAEIGYLSDT